MPLHAPANDHYVPSTRQDASVSFLGICLRSQFSALSQRLQDIGIDVHQDQDIVLPPEILSSEAFRATRSEWRLRQKYVDINTPPHD